LKTFSFVPFILTILAGGLVSAQPVMPPDRVGIDEKLSYPLPGGLSFHDEKGTLVDLRSIMRRPTVLSLVYLSCTHICPTLLGSLAEALGKIDLTPGRDYSLVTVSFDDRDLPELARQKKENYIKAVGRPVSETSWIFLTGDAQTINAFTDAVGFAFRRDRDGFSHPRVLLFFSPDGRIARYLYGTTFSPFDLRMALAEAAGTEKALSLDKLLLFLYHYDRGENRYLFNLPKVLAVILVAATASFLLFWLVAKKQGLSEGQRLGEGNGS